MLVSLKDVLQKAQKEKYAVGMFNTVSLEMAKGVLRAAEECNSPVIIGTAEVLLPYAELDELAYFLVPMAKKAKVPVVLHFDHGMTPDRIRQAIALGFTSVMYDCSTQPFEINRSLVAEMTQAAHKQGVSVEAELGHVGANEHSAEGYSSDAGVYTDVEEAVSFVQHTGVDALAVAIGSAHGAYKSAPKLQLDLLKQLHAQVETPLVLHGGSGLTDEDFRNSIANGIAKVNIFTDIDVAAADAAQNRKPGGGFTSLMPGIIEAVQQAVQKKMALFGSCGKA